MLPVIVLEELDCCVLPVTAGDCVGNRDCLRRLVMRTRVRQCMRRGEIKEPGCVFASRVPLVFSLSERRGGPDRMGRDRQRRFAVGRKRGDGGAPVG